MNELQSFKEDLLTQQVKIAIRSYLYGKSHEAVLNMNNEEIVDEVIKMLYNTDETLFTHYINNLSSGFIIAVTEEILDIIPSYLVSD